MIKPLHDAVILVSGATRGAGRAIALELGSSGATVYVAVKRFPSLSITPFLQKWKY
ncbi:MAG: hypothetical protein ACYCYP_06095 [Leptospirales bacterium]